MINMTSLSVMIHIIQALLSPVSVWVTVEDGLLAGMYILSLIGILVFIDILLASSLLKAKRNDS